MSEATSTPPAGSLAWWVLVAKQKGLDHAEIAATVEESGDDMSLADAEKEYGFVVATLSEPFVSATPKSFHIITWYKVHVVDVLKTPTVCVKCPIIEDYLEGFSLGARESVIAMQGGSTTVDGMKVVETVKGRLLPINDNPYLLVLQSRPNSRQLFLAGPSTYVNVMPDGSFSAPTLRPGRLVRQIVGTKTLTRLKAQLAN